MNFKANNDAVAFEKVRKALPKTKPLANSKWQSNGGNGSYSAANAHPTPSMQCRPAVVLGNQQ